MGRHTTCSRLKLRCYRCKTCLPRKQFALCTTITRGYQEWCRTCRGNYQRGQGRKLIAKHGAAWRKRNPQKVLDMYLRATYGITADEYDKLQIAQNGVCAICKQPEHRCFKGKLKRLAVDHDHKTGKVRGLLCQDCNRMLGDAKDAPTILFAGAHYLGLQHVQSS